jgi:hypothetical protein
VELNAAAVAPILLNIKAFVPTAAAVIAGRYLDRDPGWAALDAAAREERLALRAGRLGESIRNFHGVPANGETDGRVTARKLMGRVGLVGGSDDPSGGADDMLPLKLGGISKDDAAAAERKRIARFGNDNNTKNNGGGDGDSEGAFDEVVAAGLRLHPFFSTFTTSEVHAVRRRSQRFPVEMGHRMFRQGDAGRVVTPLPAVRLVT